jgi:hypothetical protein
MYLLDMDSKFHNVRWLATLILTLTVLTSCASKSVLTTGQAGHWEGNARIIMTWCHQTNLLVKLDIGPDGGVTGTVGDATLRQGRFLKNRGWLGRKLNIETDYIIKGHLDGPIVAAEAITRARVFMPLNFDDGLIKGGVATSGTWFGGKNGMVLTARSLKLTRLP